MGALVAMMLWGGPDMSDNQVEELLENGEAKYLANFMQDV